MTELDAFNLSEDERDLVRSLIVADPGLVLDDDQVMRRLIGARTGGERNIVDLRDRLVERLEKRLEKMVAHHRSIVAAAYENVEGARQLHRAVLALIEPADLSSFLQRLTHDVPQMLALDEARLCLEADVAETGPAAGYGTDLHGRVMALPAGAVAEYMALDGAHGAPVVLREAGMESELIFGEASPVQSEALMRLEIPGSAAMLALGSADPRKFDPSHGTDLLVFFAGVVERLLLQRLSDSDE